MLFKISREAKRDLQDIARYTYRRWGKRQRDQYVLGLDKAFHLLGENPSLGRSCDDIRSGYFRYEHSSHIVFYKRMDKHILISRILHKNT